MDIAQGAETKGDKLRVCGCILFFEDGKPEIYYVSHNYRKY